MHNEEAHLTTTVVRRRVCFLLVHTKKVDNLRNSCGKQSEKKLM